MTTFRKLPTSSPTTAKAASIFGGHSSKTGMETDPVRA
jgi:hypothetical protein